MDPDSIQGISTQAGVTYALVDIIKNRLDISGRAAQFLALVVGVVYACGDTLAHSPGPITFSRAWDAVIRGLLTGAAAMAAHSVSRAHAERKTRTVKKDAKTTTPGPGDERKPDVIVAGDGVGKGEAPIEPAKEPTLELDREDIATVPARTAGIPGSGGA